MSHFINMTLLAAGLLVVVGCGDKGSADTSSTSCEALGAHFAELALAEVTKLADDSPIKQAAEAQLALVPKARAALISECRDEKWSAELRSCFVAAKSPAEFKTNCAALAQRVGGSTPAAAPAPAKAPAPTDPPPPTDSTPNPEGAN